MSSRLRDKRSNTDDVDDPTPKGKSSTSEKGKGRGVGTGTGTLDGWVEPAIAKKASYADHNGSALGVLEHMQPLGETPPTKTRAKARADGSRKSTRGGMGEVTRGGLEGQQTTPNGTPQPPLGTTERPASTKPGDSTRVSKSSRTHDTQLTPGDTSRSTSKTAKASTKPTLATRTKVEDDKDGDYEPKANGKKKARPNLSRAQILEELKDLSTVPLQRTIPPSRRSYVYTGIKLADVIEDAKRRAKEQGDPILSAAVHEIYLQSLHDDHLGEILEHILRQIPTQQELDIFLTYIKAAKEKVRAAKSSQHSREGETGRKETRDLPMPEAGEQQQPPASKSVTSGPSKTSPQPSSAVTSAKPSQKFSIKLKSSKTPNAKHSGKSTRKTTSPRKMTSNNADHDSELSELTDFEETDVIGEHEAHEQDTPPEDSSRRPAASRSSRLQPGASRDASESLSRDREVTKKGKNAARSSLTVQKNTLKRSSAEAEIDEDEFEREFQAKKQKLREGIIPDRVWEESNVRGSPDMPDHNLRGSSKNNAHFVSPAIALQPTSSRLPDAQSDPDSPLSSPASSHHSARRTLHSKPSGKRAKTKQSPEKKHTHVYNGIAGMGRATRTESPIGDDASEELSENNDFCSSCHGTGFLLCCDGCARSFHFACLDPPLSSDASELDEPFYCHICVARRPLTAEQPEKPSRGLFAPLLSSLNKRNPSTFALPSEIREFYEGVGTDKDGQFVETVRAKIRRGNGQPEKPDDYKTKDAKGNTVLCYACSKSSIGSRPIIQCDECSTPWHLDCLDPPLANPPGRDQYGLKTNDWMCPLHVDHDLRRIDIKRLYPPRFGRKIHVRKPRTVRAVETALNRGMRNTGVVEVIDDDSDDSESDFYFDEDQRDESIVYKMPASGIKLDFIDKVKQNRVQDVCSHVAHKRAGQTTEPSYSANLPPSQLAQPNFTRRSIQEQQIALNLAQWASTHLSQSLDLGGSKIENLVASLIAEAPKEVVNDMTRGEEGAATPLSAPAVTHPPSPPVDHPHKMSARETKDLQMLQELIKRRLEHAGQ